MNDKLALVIEIFRVDGNDAWYARHQGCVGWGSTPAQATEILLSIPKVQGVLSGLGVAV